jgi:hypothetical protein
MPKMQTLCPRCRQPILAEVQQLFDLTSDPTAKQKLLSRSTNVARCQACGYEGLVSTPIVYHDPEKELLLTFFPPDLGVAVNDQEKQIGPLINQVVNALPAEKRKGYLFQPQTMLTYQTLLDKVLEADGITKEMIEAQQKRIALIQRLISTQNAEDRRTIIQQESALADGELFTILSTLMQSAAMQGDEKTANVLNQVQAELLQETEVGRKLLADSQETQEALKQLDAAQKTGLTREKLLEILASIKSETSLATLVGLTRSALDYQFFQVLSEQIEKETDEKKSSLVSLRDKLLDLTREIDLELKQRLQKANELLEKILKAEETEKMIEKSLPEVDDFFSQAVQMAFEKAREDNDLPRIEKIQKVIGILEKFSAPPAEIEFIQKLLEAPDNATLQQLLDEQPDQVNDQFLQTVNAIISEGESRNQSPELVEKLRGIYKQALRISMQRNLKS